MKYPIGLAIAYGWRRNCSHERLHLPFAIWITWPISFSTRVRRNYSAMNWKVWSFSRWYRITNIKTITTGDSLCTKTCSNGSRWRIWSWDVSVEPLNSLTEEFFTVLLQCPCRPVVLLLIFKRLTIRNIPVTSEKTFIRTDLCLWILSK